MRVGIDLGIDGREINVGFSVKREPEEDDFFGGILGNNGIDISLGDSISCNLIENIVDEEDNIDNELLELSDDIRDDIEVYNF